jgi:hypothetical protein
VPLGTLSADRVLAEHVRCDTATYITYSPLARLSEAARRALAKGVAKLQGKRGRRG